MKAKSITVGTKEKAWEVANELFISDYMYDSNTSERAGYPVYTSTLEATNTDKYFPAMCHIADLEGKLEVTIVYNNYECEYTTIHIEAEKTEEEFASDIAEEIVVRTYDEKGNSEDIRRKTTENEKAIIKKLVKAAITSAKWERFKNVESVLNTIEFAFMGFLPEANSYLSIYLPLSRVLDTIKEREENKK